ncbi:MAG: DUF4333 domain-containing protein [Cyanobacteria bacterium P01_F01_bin.4]
MVPLLRLGLLLWLVALSGCYRLNANRAEAEIKADIERQGRRVSLKSVTCPGNVSKQAGAYFRCVGELPTGEMFTINVTQQDDQGSLTWDVPSSKALINLVSLEEKIQTGFSKDLGKRPDIDCGAAYRINQRGESFECDVVGSVTVGSNRIESVLVKVDAEGNLQWQEVRQAATPASVAAGQAAGSTPGSTPATSPSVEASEASAGASSDEEDDAAPTVDLENPRDPAVIEAELPDVTDD